VTVDEERDGVRAEKAARYRGYAAEAEQRVAWQTDSKVASVYRSVVRAWTDLADELEQVPLPTFGSPGVTPLHLHSARDPETRLDRLRRRARHARELAAQVPDPDIRSRLVDYAVRLEAETAEHIY
jgi:hypothetical protein